MPLREELETLGAQRDAHLPIGEVAANESDWRQGSTVPLHLASNTQGLQTIWQVPTYHNG